MGLACAAQEWLARAVDPIRLRLILDESVLSRAVAAPDVMRAQLEHVIEAGSAAHVTIQVLRLGCQQRQLPALVRDPELRRAGRRRRGLRGGYPRAGAA